MDDKVYQNLKEIGLRNCKIAGGLMIALHEVQDEFGYISIEMQEVLAKYMKIPLANIYGVASFYSHFVLEPRGKKQIHVCLGTACYVKNAQKIIDKVEQKLGIEPEKTTEDGEYSLHTTRCIGACGLAPVASINDEVFGHLENKELDTFISNFNKSGEK